MINNPEFEEILVAAEFISHEIDYKLIEIYETYIQNKEPEKSILNHFIKKIDPFFESDLDLKQMIAYGLYNIMEDISVEKAILASKETRRNYKKNWFTSIHKEYLAYYEGSLRKKSTPLHSYAATRFLECQNSSLNRENGLETYIEKTYQTIFEWKNDTSSYITEFPLLPYKTAKSIGTTFINDLIFGALQVVKFNFKGSITGYHVHQPNVLLNHPILSYRSTSINFSSEDSKMPPSFVNEYTYKNGEQTSKVKLFLDTDEIFKTLVSPNSNETTAIIHTAKELDQRDGEIIARLFSMVNGRNFANNSIFCDVKDLISSVYNIPLRQSVYKDLIDRLKKLSKYHYEIEIINTKTKRLLGRKIFGILDSIDITYSDDEKNIPLFFEFRLSTELLEAYVKNNFTSILATEYDKIKSPQTKGIMLLLQKERLKVYYTGKQDVDLFFDHFKSAIKLYGMKNKQLAQELQKHLDILKESSSIIKDYDIYAHEHRIHITFFPLSNDEILAYEYERGISTIDTPHS